MVDKNWVFNNPLGAAPDKYPLGGNVPLGQKEKKDNSHLYQAVDIESLANDMLDTKMANNILGDLKRHGGFQMHKPLLVPSGPAAGAPGINPGIIDKAKMRPPA
jgi:hypothetical protein